MITVIDYLFVSFFSFIFRNPAEYNPILRLSCLAPYGRPVISDLVLGGFPNEKEIMNATALIITFYNKNSAEKNELGAVEAWEQA